MSQIHPLMRRWLAVPLAALLPLVAGCASKQPPVPPVLDLAGIDCVATPDLASATPLTFDEKKTTAVTTTVDAMTGCLKTDAGVSTYEVYRLPDTDQPYIYEVASIPQGKVMFGPKVEILDQDGNELKEVSRDSFLFRSAALSVQRRSNTDERYLLVMSDPTLVGQTLKRLSANVDRSVATTGLFTFTVYNGSDQSVDLVFAHNGKLTVSVWALPVSN